MENMLKHRKALIVIDDLDDQDVLDALAGRDQWFGSGSRIIVVTKNKHFLRAHEIDHVYEVCLPSKDLALEMFCRSAFRKSSPPDGFMELSSEVALRAGNLPLGLNVLGSNLRGKDKGYWIDMLPRLRGLDGKFEKSLRVSNDGLNNRKDETIFRHIACLFNGEKVSDIKLLLAKSNLDINIGLINLVDKSLIRERFNTVEMHSLLQEMGKNIVRTQSNEPGEREFLVDLKDICNVLEDNTVSFFLLFINLTLYDYMHGVAVKLGLGTDAFVGNSLVVMYCDCGKVIDAISVFIEISKKNIVSWNSIIVGCAQHGRGKWVFVIFGQMIRLNKEPDEITFTGLLSACSHCGFLQKGRKLFDYMSRGPNHIDKKIQHYTCMVDILGRCGLKEAEELIESMLVKPNEMDWLALLSACRMHSDVDRAEKAAATIFNMDSESSAGYVLLSNIYASAGRWSNVSKLRAKMKQKGIMKTPGSSWVVLRGKKHEFFSGDLPHCSRIYEKLQFLRDKLKELDYTPDYRSALHDVEDEQKEEMLWCHSERLAIGFALTNTAEGSTIRVLKNLRVCEDCHTVIKLIQGLRDVRLF